MKDFKEFLDNWLGMKYWPFGKGSAGLFIMALILPALIILAAKIIFRYKIEPDMFLTFPALLILELPLTIHKSDKLENVYTLSLWCTLLFFIAVVLGNSILPGICGISPVSLEEVLFFGLFFAPFFYGISLWSICRHRKNLLEIESTKLPEKQT